MKTLLSFFCLSLFTIHFSAHSQNFEKIKLSETNLSDYYLVVKPLNQIKGVLVLLPGFGERPESIFPETKLHNVAYIHGIMTVAFGVGNKLYIDKAVKDKINTVLKDVIQHYSVSSEKFVVGGYSAGGTIFLRYAELTQEKPDEYPVKIKGIFTVDSPVDLVDIYNYFERELQKNYSDPGVNEARFVKGLMDNELGSPDNSLLTYKQLSPFYKETEGPGNEKYLKNMPVRVYHDIDVLWQLQNRGRSLYDCNCLNSSEMITRLRLMGNENAEFIQSKNPGLRSNGQRHTHSWSIVNEVENIQWIKKVLGVE